MPMASTTKIMTCVLACESTRLNDTVVVTNEMLAGTEGSLIYLKPDDKITLYDLAVAAMLASGNDAANAVAFCLSGSIDDFVALMNKKACSIGMKNTIFVTPSGLDEKNHHSTAYDMALLASYAMKSSCFSEICALKSAQITINGKKQTVYNHNKLLSSDNDFVGVKTGFTEKAGRCLVSAYNYNGNMIITVTLNAPDDWQDHKRLVAFAKKQFTTKKDNKTFALDVVGAPKNTVQCGYEYNVTVYKNVDIRLYYYPFVYAPLKCGDTVGECKSCLCLSNLGVVRLPEVMAPYVARMDFIIGVQSKAPHNCGVLTWNDTVYINCIRSIREPELELHFYRVLHQLGLPVKVESNQR